MDAIRAAFRHAKSYANGGSDGDSYDPALDPAEDEAKAFADRAPVAVASPADRARAAASQLSAARHGTPAPQIPASTPPGEQSLTSYTPTMKERFLNTLSDSLAGQSLPKQNFVEGIGHIMDWVPGIGQALQAQEGIQRGDYQTAAAAFLPGAAEGFGGFAKKAATVVGEQLAADMAAGTAYKVGEPKQGLGTRGDGFFTGFSNGKNYYVKQPQGGDLGNAQREVLASKLYEAAGVPVPETHLTRFPNGKVGIASETIPNAKKLIDYTTSDFHKVPGLHEHFPADAWLNNRDVIGAGTDNPWGNMLVDYDGNARRIDFGGALDRSGLGKPKSLAPGVNELDTMLSKDYNSTTSKAFAGYTPERGMETAKRIAAIPDQTIDDLVAQHGLPQSLADVIKKRRDDLANRYGIGVDQQPKFDLDPSVMGKATKTHAGTGSNPGGFYSGFPDGIDRYVKTMDEPHARNEVLANRLYEMWGVPVAHNELTMANGKYAVSSHMINNAWHLNKEMPGAYPMIPGLHDHFAADAMLANWDVVGLNRDNVLIGPGGQAYRIDHGGALAYRAQGEPKGALFTSTVGELDTMRKKGEAGKVFKDVELNPLNKTALRIAGTTDDEIKSVVKQYGPRNASLNNALADKLIARRDDLAKQYGIKEGTGGFNPDDSEEVLAALAKKDEEATGGGEHAPGTFPELPPPLKLMQLNKTHSTEQLAASLAKWDVTKAVEGLGKIITDKQLTKLGSLINTKDPGQLAAAMLGMPGNQKANVLSWMSAKQMGAVHDAMQGLDSKAAAFEGGPDGYAKELQEYYKNLDAHLDHEYAIATGEATEPGWTSPVFPQKPSKKSDDVYTDHLKPLDWKNFKPKGAQGFQPADIPNADLKVLQQQHGFNPYVGLWRGHISGNTLTSSGYPEHIKPPGEVKNKERAYFLSDDPNIAEEYGQLSGKYIARAPKAAYVDYPALYNAVFHGGEGEPGYTAAYSGSIFHKLIDTAKAKGFDLVVVGNVDDVHPYGSGHAQNQYLFINPAGLRAATAKFDSTKWHHSYPLWGVFGGGLFTYGAMKGEKNSGNMARGGKVRGYTMPLKPGSGKAVVSQNIREFHTGPTYRHTAAKFGKTRANKQAIAVALNNARKYAEGGSAPQKMAFGGLGGPNLNMENIVARGSLYGLRREGMINSSIPGRTDKLPMNVKAGSYVLPADIPSALGQGNSMAGGVILKKMFSSGPVGPPMRGAGRTNMPHMNFVKPPSMGSMGKPKMGFADGGTKGEQPRGAESGMDESVDHVPIIAAGGEYIIDPSVVRDIGHGDIKAGHRVLDKFVLNTRAKHIDTLKKLKPPKK